jgi:hypothetical protein
MGFHRDRCGVSFEMQISSLVFVVEGDSARTVREIHSPILLILLIMSNNLRGLCVSSESASGW